jgi:hypothetical protein
MEGGMERAASIIPDPLDHAHRLSDVIQRYRDIYATSKDQVDKDAMEWYQAELEKEAAKNRRMLVRVK